MRRTLFTIALVACGGGDAKPQTQAAATAAQPPPPPEVTASAAPTAAPSETPSATPAETIAALDAGVGLAALTRTEPDDEPLGAGGGYGHGHGSLGGHAPHVTIRQGTTMINGRLPPEVIQRIVRQHYGRFRACYEHGLRQDPSLAGRVAIKFVIGSKGDVTLAADGGSEMTNVDVVSCVMVGFKSLIFPKPERGIVTVVYPLIFSSSH